MTERDRLKKLLNEAFIKSDDNFGMPSIRQVTDYLVENGVIALPCKVGDTIYRCGDPIKKVYEWEIEHIEIYFDEIVFVDDSDNVFTADDIGKTVFLTREEAEEALKERSEK